METRSKNWCIREGNRKYWKSSKRVYLYGILKE